MGDAGFVVDGHDIEMYADAEAAALNVEGYDVPVYDFFGGDGTVYEATVEGPKWGPVRLHRTQRNRLEDLIHLLRAEADYRGLELPPETPDQPEAIWAAILASEGRGVHRVAGGGSAAPNEANAASARLRQMRMAAELLKRSRYAADADGRGAPKAFTLRGRSGQAGESV